MKKLFILFVVVMIAASMMAQDIIYRAADDSVCAKIITVNKSEITYRLAGYEDGPLFTIDKNDVTAIRFANGVYQSFARATHPQAHQQETAPSAQTQPKKSAFFIGGTANVGYTTAFSFYVEPVIGYEFNDRVAVGTSVGAVITAVSGASAIAGIVEPFVRVCAWHNDIVFIDFKATAGIGFTNVMFLCQAGIRPSLRVRLSPHCDMSADIGLFGAQWTYSSEEWTPTIGISATSAGLWFAYRF